MASPSVLLNKRSLESLGVAHYRSSPFTAVPQTRRAVTLRGRRGVVRLTASPDGAVRTMRIEGTLLASPANLDTAARQLSAWIERGTNEVQFAHDLTKVYFAECTKCDISVYDPQLDMSAPQVGARVEIELEATDPCAFDTSIRPLAIGQQAVEVPMGDSDVSGIIRLVEGTNPKVTVRHPSGEIISFLWFNGVTLTAGTQRIEANSLTLESRLYTNLTQANADDYITDDSAFPLIVPYRARDLISGRGPTIEVSSGWGEFLYARAHA